VQGLAGVLALALCLTVQPAIGRASAPPPTTPSSKPGFDESPADALKRLQAGGAQFTDKVQVGLVLVPVVVRKRAGYADHLDRKDFTLIVDGRPVAIDSFERRADAPCSLVVLQDLSGSMATEGKLDQSREAVRFFLQHALPGDEFAVATFASGTGEVEVPFTSDTGVVASAIGMWRGWGTTALHDAVAWIPEISLDSRNPKRFALVITDGVDNASRLSPEQARDLVRAAQVPVYVLGLGAGSPYELGAQNEKIYRYADVLNLLAATTGGRYYSISSFHELRAALQAIADDLRHEYVLGFATGEGRSSYRKLHVEVRGGEQAVVFRRGYQGPPPASPKVGG
jgi:VWFA-related protein